MNLDTSKSNINNKNQFINNLSCVLGILLMFSFNIKALFESGNITMLLLVLLLLLNVIYYLMEKRIYNITISDCIVYIFICYMFIHSIIFNTEINTIRAISMSFIPYFLFRYVDFNKDTYEIVKKIINILAYSIMISITIKYLKLNQFTYRMSLQGSNSVAIGELIGFFCIINILNLKEFQSSYISRINYIIGIVFCMVILGARGAVIAVIFTTFLICLFNSKNKLKIIISLSLLSIFYYILFNNNSILIEKIPSMARFSIEGIINDPSVVGNRTTIGRMQLFTDSFNIIKSNFVGIGLGRIYSHNIFLEIWSSLGVIGMSVFIILILNILYKCKCIFYSNKVLVAIFIFLLIYRQSSFAIYAHKSLFMIMAIIVTKYQNSKFRS
ncbi:hypothetical protein G6Z35_11275 [Clostridium perfringens]|uniref:O-antigen ligase family protein n=1 Tax=Clostridium perfringens TaxID=1502 RepID=UPI0013E39576|nr:O-antigen ligase family protein [Clostridium perfringens]NGU13358.1 hypothetical protein [Clostridium perfringens]